MKIIVTEDAAYVADDNGANIADIAFIGGLATMMFGGGEGIAAQQADLASRQDAELREQAVAALANDYCPPHLEADKKAMLAAIRADRNTVGPICEAHFAERWKWAREIAPSLPVVRK